MATNWTKEAKSATTFAKDTLLNIAKSFLLMEDGHRLLWEDDSRIVINYGWTKEAKA